MYTVRREGAELLWRSELGLHTPAAEPGFGKAPFSCQRKKQPHVSGAGVAAQPGVSFLQEASGLALLCASSEEKQSEADSEALRVHFAGSAPRYRGPVGCQPLRISVDTSANSAAGARPTPGW